MAEGFGFIFIFAVILLNPKWHLKKGDGGFYHS